jgi:hypothetical protein
MQAWRPQERLVDSARAYFHREEFLTRLHRRMDYAERSYHRALKQLLQLQSGYPDPAQARASAPELLPIAPAPARIGTPAESISQLRNWVRSCNSPGGPRPGPIAKPIP